MTTPQNPNQVTLPPSPYGKKDSGLAIASLVCGLLGWSFVPFIGSIAAIITGHLAKKEIRDSGGMIGGDGMAIAGLILGYTLVGLVLLAVLCFVLFFAALIPAMDGSFDSFTMLIKSVM